ncbi:hypothetical protein [Streptomyces sclerotialus]|uniref:hypothetical protein n=1 Tax=Streptomyces sclerotialus TaxID=1957 RepID=UPI0004C5E9D0
MVTSSHEAAHQALRERPALLAPVFRVLGVPLPDKVSVEVLSVDDTGDTGSRPSGRCVDSVLRVVPAEGEAFLLAVEAQGRRDPAKAARWMYYLARLRAEHGCPVLLLVVCPDEATATWAAGPFTTGVTGWTGLTMHPLVLGPHNVPVVTDTAEAGQDPAMAALSALTHSRSHDVAPALEALASALGPAAPEAADYCTELLDIGLGDTPARSVWREMMTVNGSFFPGRGTLVEEKFLEGKAAGRAEGRAEGRLEGRAVGHAAGVAEGIAKAKAHAVLSLLAARGVPVPEAARERITGCAVPDVLDRWFDRAVTASSAQVLFTDEAAAH